MEYKKAATILVDLLENPALSPAEKQALSTAIGVLAWASLSDNRIKKLKAKREEAVTK
ncbi:MAG: hypothetical protein HUU49_03280 [Candidatus Buchananbacteria bacterium]|nr:hypothetical protein [Candidatus Buchananbacteria bacterium]